MTARFRITGRFDVSHVQQATVSIDRRTGLFNVRPLRRRTVYTLPLAIVAAIVVARIARVEAAEVFATKRARRQARRR